MTRESFYELMPGIGGGQPQPADWCALADFPLVILVGVTGVGKSTTIGAMAKSLHFTLLPNRRQLTDRLIIGPLQEDDGLPIKPVADRAERFAYTRRYRQMHPGGMADALASLLVDSERHQALLVFDGLRGVNEVSAAATALPSALFVLLEAPDLIRVERLLGREDSFDRVNTLKQPVDAGQPTSFADLGVAEAADLFQPEEEAYLLSLVNRGDVDAIELQSKLRIVLEERRNYDPAATRKTLIDLAPLRTLAIDTTTCSPTEAANRIARLF